MVLFDAVFSFGFSMKKNVCFCNVNASSCINDSPVWYFLCFLFLPLFDSGSHWCAAIHRTVSAVQRAKVEYSLQMCVCACVSLWSYCMAKCFQRLASFSDLASSVISKAATAAAAVSASTPAANWLSTTTTVALLYLPSIANAWLPLVIFYCIWALVLACCLLFPYSSLLSISFFLSFALIQW